MAVACPTCFGAIAVGTELLGQAAECPLCSRGFRVPLTGVADAPQQPASAAGDATTATAARQPHHRRETSPEPPRHEQPGRAELAGQTEPASQTGSANQAEPSDAVAGPPAPMAELHFQEPVRTVGSGDQMIMLRRLTPEEKAVRRARRNLIMMLTGVSILMAIVLLFGTKRPRRRD